jgi:hypothetical protein
MYVLVMKNTLVKEVDLLHDQRCQRFTLTSGKRHDVPSGNVHIQVRRESAPDSAHDHDENGGQEYGSSSDGHR